MRKMPVPRSLRLSSTATSMEMIIVPGTYNNAKLTVTVIDLRNS